MTTEIRANLAIINGFIAIMFNDESQDRTLVLEAVEYMVTAVRSDEPIDLMYIINRYTRTENPPELQDQIIMYANCYPKD